MRYKLLIWFRNLWLALFFVLILMSIVGIFLKEPTAGQAWTRIQDIFSPFNVANFLVMLVVISPALIANYFIDKIEEKRTKARLAELRPMQAKPIEK